MQDSVNYITEINSNVGECMDTDGFESLEPVECAFKALREILPQNESGENLSELEVLKLAMEYIHDLEQILHFENSNKYQWLRRCAGESRLYEHILLVHGVEICPTNSRTF